MSSPEVRHALLWFRTPDPLVIASDPWGYEIHKTPADRTTNGQARYELRRLTGTLADSFEIMGESHLCDMAMAAGEKHFHAHTDGGTR